MQEKIDLKKIQKKSKNFFKNLLLLVIVIIVILIIGEIFARMIIGNKLDIKIEKDGFHHLEPNQKGWQHVDSVFSKAKINNIASRGEDVNISLVAEKEKYIFLGDSFTFGWLLKDDETLPEQFKGLLNLSDEDVINYGTPGYGIDHMTASYEYYGEFFGEGDVFIITLIDHDFIRPINPYEPEKNILKIVLGGIKKQSSFLSFVYESLGPIIYKAKDSLNIQPKFEGKYFNEGGFEKIREFGSKINEKNQTLIVVFYEYNETSFSKNAGVLCEKNELYCVTNVPSFISNIEEGKKIYASDGGHPSKYSNFIVAKGLVNFINDNSLFLR